MELLAGLDAQVHSPKPIKFQVSKAPRLSQSFSEDKE